MSDHFDHHFDTVTDETNPKDLIGARKISITLLPPVAILVAARAMMEGARKYGPYNWREKKVQANIYVDACLRHLLSWATGEEVDPESQIEHLGHAIACCAILLDAQATGNLVDNRFKDTSFAMVLRILNEELKECAST